MQFLDRGMTVEHGNGIKLSTKRTQLTAKTNIWQDKLNGYKQKPIHGNTKRLSNRTRGNLG